MGKRTPRTKTTAAKANPAQNACRHGLTAQVPTQKALAHYRLIVENPQQSVPCYATHHVTRLAWDLAVCEEQLERAQAAERDHVLHPPGAVAKNPKSGRTLVREIKALQEIIVSGTPDIEGAVAAAREAAYRKEADLLQRYRREAETKRRKAMKTFCRALVADDPSPPPRLPMPDEGEVP